MAKHYQVTVAVEVIESDSSEYFTENDPVLCKSTNEFCYAEDVDFLELHDLITAQIESAFRGTGQYSPF